MTPTQSLLSRLARMEEVVGKATEGPWYKRYLDDGMCMNLRAISTEPDTGRHEAWPNFDASTMVAITLIQSPRMIDHDSERWDENMDFIVTCRNDLPQLLLDLRQLIEGQQGEIEGLRKIIEQADLLRHWEIVNGDFVATVSHGSEGPYNKPELAAHLAQMEDESGS